MCHLKEVKLRKLGRQLETLITGVDRTEGPLRHRPPTRGFWKAWAASPWAAGAGAGWGRGGGTWRCSIHGDSRPPSPGAALAAHGARGAVALLHDHADVGFHELGHVHHLPGEQNRPTVTSF